MKSESHSYRSQTVCRPHDLFIGIGHVLSCKKALVVVATCFAIIASVATTSAETVVLYGNNFDPFPQRPANGNDGWSENPRVPGAQPFVTGEFGIVSSISLPVAVNGSPSGVVHFEIWDDFLGRPGTKVAWVGDIDLDGWTGADLEYQLVTFDRPVTGLKPNTKYYLLWDNTDTDVSAFNNTNFRQIAAGSEGTNNAAKWQVKLNTNWIEVSTLNSTKNYLVMEILEISPPPLPPLYGNIPDPFPAFATNQDMHPEDEVANPFTGAQPFVTGELGIVSSISLPVAVSGSPTGVVHFEIWDDNSGKPGTKVAWVGDIDLDSWTGADRIYQLVTFNRPVTGLEPNTKYYVVNINTDIDVSGSSNTFFRRTTASSEGTNNAAKLQVIFNGNWSLVSNISPFGADRNYQVMEILEISEVDILEPKLINISTRGMVGTGDEVLIGGFVISGDAAGVTILVRGIGPALGDFGVANTIEDPVVRVFDASGTWIAENDDWYGVRTRADIAAATTIVGAFALGIGSLDAALILTDLVPGSYTVQLSGKSATLQNGLLEVYKID